ncbi:hypothetical protein [Aquimarina sp. AU119]|uniref:hypothetical protein n=1 Tax=Aquimarina sp. AU119 TaxID=2108528 RepID=UPI00135A5E1E|nr:hypothetical protein [Aquimarina sp. AU119]
MKKFKKLIRRFTLILLIIMASLLPIPIFFTKKEGKFNDEHTIELVEQKQEDTMIKTKKLGEELNS